MTNLKLLYATALSLLVCGCSSSTIEPQGAHDKPAKVEKLPVETELATVTLSEDAERRLGIATAPVTRQNVSPRRTLGGEAMVPVGRTIIVSTPVSGLVASPGSRELPLPGTHVTAGTEVLSLVPLLSPERDVPTPAEQVQMVGAQANLVAAQTVALGDIERSAAEVDAAKITLQRAQKLFHDRAGAKRLVDDAEAQLNIAQSVWSAAQQREKQLSELMETLKKPGSGGGGELQSGGAVALPMLSPIEGLINRLNVSQGQTVAAGTALFEVINLDAIWIRVPVFVDLLASIENEQPANLVSLSGDRLGDQASSEAIVARPIAAPPTANAATSSADLYYEVDNRQIHLRPGQRVGVELPLTGTSESLAVPASAVLYDVHGGAWVYVAAGDRHYTRARIVVRWMADGQAILETGPAAGSHVVVAGAAELFGTEFGTGK
ncbi:MAG: HlyD family efflux transporter periplasmic adaptor subunit [Pirellulaceae bacterium]|nr:HlyD family efflux transporter periplasmic adaptor subunit [Pirellulaceae bacterium]